MKHAAAEEKPAKKIAKNERIVSVKESKKVTEKALVLPSKKTKAERSIQETEPTNRKENLKNKNVKTAAAVVSKSKPAKKIAPVLEIEKAKKKKDTAAVSIEKPAKIINKSAPAAEVKSPAAKKKVESVVVSDKKQTLKTKPSIVVQKFKRQMKKTEPAASPLTISGEQQKIKSAVNIGRINAALKAIEAAQLESAKNDRKEKKSKKLKAAEVKHEKAVQAVETKPKTLKPIGAAVFRGRKNRYDFQVYPIDFAFENVPGIYVISKRKTDSKKRGHHALVCIGQTDSVVDELKKHTRSKCVKTFEANVISILAEASEKKRLKIEEDLRAAHAVACNLALE